MSIVFDLERTNQLNLLPDKDLVDLCPPIEPYQVTKNLKTIFPEKYPYSSSLHTETRRANCFYGYQLGNYAIALNNQDQSLTSSCYRTGKIINWRSPLILQFFGINQRVN
ncbi:MAG: hypothetical protein EWV91_05710 [Microcystis aeruginosa Ma_QC_Ca_00000000_S207]|uniref:Uncharacterized protein n=1 Tax=Microcystis aeruginosa Ma_QC_Ca_00000000_S207 TaxID=2486251 RepID=A0A552FV33_MICAE|nr:MAG: hypothetical protein EWV91_05710 [Microcystis aeruginosa Ma_QC_Ca_00000000_S207]